jgi:sugar phosphate isomerase/epimerase
MTALDLLERAKELDVKVVQIGPNLPLDKLRAQELTTLVQRAQQWEIELEVGTRGVLTDHLRRWIAIAKEVGASLLRSVPEVDEGNTPPPQQLVQLLRDIRPDLTRAGLRLALENGRIPATQLSEVLNTVASPWIGVTLDTANSLAIPEGTEQVVRTLARHTMCLHVKDFVVRRFWHMMGFTVEGRPAGQGQMNFPWILEQLRDAGATANAILEFWPPEQKTLHETIALEQAWAIESVAYLRQYVLN